MKDTALFLVKSIVDNPDKITITEEPTEFGYTNINVSVDKEDMGKVIGKQGKIIRALRILLRIAAIKENKKINLQLLEADSD